MSLHGRSKKQPPNQRVCSSMVRIQMKRPRVAMPVAEAEASASMERRWDEMDHEILVNMMKCLAQGSCLAHCFTLHMPFLVCKTWRSAVLDALFPPGNVLDLCPFVVLPENEKRNYLFYLKFLLQRPHQYAKLFYPACYYGGGVDILIAQRLPKLKCIVQHSRFIPFTLGKMIPYWPELNEAHCQAALIPVLSEHCKNIRRLDLCGRIGDDKACVLASQFPQLVHLSIQSCILSPNALSIILQGRLNLTYLDTRHAFCIKGFIHSPIKGKVIEWDEDDARRKAIDVKTYLHCARKYCSYCSPIYSPDISNEDLARFSTF